MYHLCWLVGMLTAWSLLCFPMHAIFEGLVLPSSSSPSHVTSPHDCSPLGTAPWHAKCAFLTSPAPEAGTGSTSISLHAFHYSDPLYATIPEQRIHSTPAGSLEWIMAVWSGLWLSGVVYDSLEGFLVVWNGIWQSVVVFGSLWWFLAVWGGFWQSGVVVDSLE